MFFIFVKPCYSMGLPCNHVEFFFSYFGAAFRSICGDVVSPFVFFFGCVAAFWDSVLPFLF